MSTKTAPAGRDRGCRHAVDAASTSTVGEQVVEVPADGGGGQPEHVGEVAGRGRRRSSSARATRWRVGASLAMAALGAARFEFHNTIVP